MCRNTPANSGITKLDIVRKLKRVSSISCKGFYACDIDSVVRWANSVLRPNRRQIKLGAPVVLPNARWSKETVIYVILFWQFWQQMKMVQWKRYIHGELLIFYYHKRVRWANLAFQVSAKIVCWLQPGWILHGVGPTNSIFECILSYIVNAKSLHSTNSETVSHFFLFQIQPGGDKTFVECLRYEKPL